MQYNNVINNNSRLCCCCCCFFFLENHFSTFIDSLFVCSVYSHQILCVYIFVNILFGFLCVQFSLCFFRKIHFLSSFRGRKKLDFIQSNQNFPSKTSVCITMIKPDDDDHFIYDWHIPFNIIPCNDFFLV